MNRKLKIVLAILIFLVFCITLIKNNDGITSGNKNDSAIIETQKPNVEIVIKEEASYEEWLASAMVIALSLHEEEFEIVDIYILSNNSLNDKKKSNGVVVSYKSENLTKYVLSTPLEQERNESGQMNLYTKDLGFATFDNVESTYLEKKSFVKVDVNTLSDLIKQSTLVTLYEN